MILLTMETRTSLGMGVAYMTSLKDEVGEGGGVGRVEEWGEINQRKCMHICITHRHRQ